MVCLTFLLLRVASAQKGDINNNQWQWVGKRGKNDKFVQYVKQTNKLNELFS